MTSRIRILAPLTILAIALAACGGSAPAAAENDRSAPSAAAAASAAPSSGGDEQTGEAAPTRPAADAPAASGTIVDITGGVTAQVTNPGVCGMDPLSDNGWGVTMDNTAGGFEFNGDDLWLLQIDIARFEGPKTYDETLTAGISFDLTDGMGTSFTGDRDAGTFTLDAGEQSGSIAVTLTDEDSGETVEISGSFACETA